MRFVVEHPLPPGTTREDIEKLQEASTKDKHVKGYRSFLNLSECKGFCLFDAPSKDKLIAWLDEHEMPYESITEVEMEGERGRWLEVPRRAAG